MTIEAIRRQFFARPFVPFVIHLAGGRNLRVAHPELFAGEPKGRTTKIYRTDGGSHIIDLLLVTDLELDPPRDEGSAGASL